MQELIYQVEFLSDIILPATSNTEGNIQNLDFIAGSNFLGMVARKYNEFGDRSFDIFHSGKVRFGDATLLHNDKPTYKMPLSFFYEKGKEETLHNHHLITDFKEFDQLKQKRNGYITQDLEEVYIDYNYSQKSAHDKQYRRSKEGSMFGYSAMRKGLKWQFVIKYDDISENDLKLLKNTILGKKRLGKSKSAQYGLVNIEFIGSEASASQNGEAKASLPNATVLYFKSRVALVDENGNPTYDLKYISSGLKEENIDYSKCQIKTSTFTPYNGAMQTKTYERICINKGSIIVLQNILEEQLEEIKKGVGVYLVEGFGEVLVNPSSLNNNCFELIKGEDNRDEDKEEIKSNLALFLKQRDRDKRIKLIRLRKVDMFIKRYKNLYKNIKPSQWGKIRSICTSGEDDFKEEIREYISTGVKAWKEQQISTLLDKKYNLECIKLLSIQMPKGKSND